jgi:hypothetical protein
MVFSSVGADQENDFIVSTNTLSLAEHHEKDSAAVEYRLRRLPEKKIPDCTGFLFRFGVAASVA